MNDQVKIRGLSLFAGIGGFDLGLERAGGFETVAVCEINPFCRAVLAKHWPQVRQYDDVRTLSADVLAGDGIAVDAIWGGFPCQNISNAGAVWGVNTGIDGDRSGLWFEYDRLIGEIKPRFVIIENVRNLIGSGLDRVLGCLAARGYDAEWQVLPGPYVGIPQARERTWIVAYAPGERMEGLFARIGARPTGQGRASSAPHLFDFAHSAFGGDDRFPQPLLRGMDDRPANWVDRVGACGNAVVPQIPELIGHAILEARAAA